MSIQNKSEVAQLLAQISAEYEAGQRALTGLAQGTSQHDFITARMERMSNLHAELGKIAGGRLEAMALIAKSLDAV